jgi:ribose 5-phosphate isomerase A
VPLETLPFAASLVMRRIKQMGGTPALREGKMKVGPVITDNGNVIIDTYFGPVNQPAELEHELKSIPGILETGLFVQMAEIAYVGKHSNVEKLTRKQTNPRKDF